MEQSKTIINGIEIPVINDGEEVWYPFTYLIEKVLLRKSIKKVNEGIQNNLSKQKIDFDLFNGTGGKQECRCINKDGIYQFMSIGKRQGWSKDQSKAFNSVIEYFELDIVPIVSYLSKEEINHILKKYNTFVQDSIRGVLSCYPDIEWRKCSRCGNEYPLHELFYSKDSNKSSSINFNNFCKNCSKAKVNINLKLEETEINNIGGKLPHIQENLKIIYKKYGEETYTAFRDKDYIKMYNHCVNNNIPVSKIGKYIDKEWYENLLLYLHDIGEISKDNLCGDYLSNDLNLGNYYSFISISEIYDLLFKGDYLLKPWKYPHVKLPPLDYEQCKIIVSNYIEEFNIQIDDIFNYSFEDIINNCSIRRNINDLLEFTVYYYNYKYAGYKFRTQGVNYYKKKDNRIFDLKYYIEQDAKLPIEKLPLYLTKMTLQRNVRSLYTVLNSKKYYQSLFDWVDEVYPDKFVIQDFEINPYRAEFDSVEESQINDILKDEFKNLIYNRRNNLITIQLKDKIPDWIILTEKGAILVEYFGLYVEKNHNNSRISDYIHRVDNKIERYKDLKGYDFLYIYPEDLNNNFENLHSKIKKIKLNMEL